MSACAKLVAISLRVDTHPTRGERRDTLAKGWQPLLASCGALGIAIPNEPAAVKCLLDRVDPAAILLSGGNDLVVYGGNAPERDAAEEAMIEWADRHERLIIGVCRGMEMLAHTFGGTLRKVEGHVGTHPIRHEDGRTATVNSHHKWAVDRLPDAFAPAAFAEDGVLEAFRHHSRAVHGIMWHPERCNPVPDDDLAMFRALLG